MVRRKFTERMVLETLIRTGHTLSCFRSKAPITLENVGTVEREHVIPIELGGADDPTNCAYSIGAAHRVQTFGNGATTANADIGKIAKAKRIVRTQKFVVRKEGGAASQSEDNRGRADSQSVRSRFKSVMPGSRESGWKKPMRGPAVRRHVEERE